MSPRPRNFAGPYCDHVPCYLEPGHTDPHANFEREPILFAVNTEKHGLLLVNRQTACSGLYPHDRTCPSCFGSGFRVVERYYLIHYGQGHDVEAILSTLRYLTYKE